jgi:hypothetical protein
MNASISLDLERIRGGPAFAQLEAGAMRPLRAAARACRRRGLSIDILG